MTRGEKDYHKRSVVSSYPVVNRLIYPTVISNHQVTADLFDSDSDFWLKAGNATISSGYARLPRTANDLSAACRVFSVQTFLFGVFIIRVQFGDKPLIATQEAVGFGGINWHSHILLRIRSTVFELSTRKDNTTTTTTLTWDDDYKNSEQYWVIIWRPNEVKLYRSLDFVLLATHTENIPDMPLNIELHDGDGNPTASTMLANEVDIYPSVFSDLSDRAARLLGIVYGSQSQKLQQRASTYELLVQLQKAGVDLDPRDRNWVLGALDVPDLSDRAGRLLGVLYGDQGQLAQRATSKDALVQLRVSGAEIDPRSIRALTAADIVAAVQSGTWSVGRTWNLGALDVPDLSDRAGRLLGVLYGDQGQLAQRASTKEALVDLARVGGTAQTGRDIAADYATLVKLHPVGPWYERINQPSLPAGASSQDSAAVTAGQRYKVTQLSYWYVGTVANVNITVGILAGGTLYYLKDMQTDPTSGTVYYWQGEAWLEAGDKIRCVVENATLNDDFNCDIFGVKYYA